MQCNTIQYKYKFNTRRYNKTTIYSTIQSNYNTVQYITLPYSYNTIQIQYDTRRDEDNAIQYIYKYSTHTLRHNTIQCKARHTMQYKYNIKQYNTDTTIPYNTHANVKWCNTNTIQYNMPYYTTQYNCRTTQCKYNTIHYTTIPHNTIQMQYNTTSIQYDAIHHILYNTIQRHCNTIQYTIQYQYNTTQTQLPYKYTTIHLQLQYNTIQTQYKYNTTCNTIRTICNTIQPQMHLQTRQYNTLQIQLKTQMQHNAIQTQRNTVRMQYNATQYNALPHNGK